MSKQDNVASLIVSRADPEAVELLRQLCAGRSASQVDAACAGALELGLRNRNGRIGCAELREAFGAAPPAAAPARKRTPKRKRK